VADRSAPATGAALIDASKSEVSDGSQSQVSSVANQDRE
jgi:hypothetical protein